jgi:RNA methyltransferase, TrmH family
MDAMRITSLQNDKVKEVVKLRERRYRDETDLFLIEGYRELLRAVDGEVEIEALFFCEELFLGGNEGALMKRIASIHYSCTEAVFRKISYRDRPDGLLAVARQRHPSLEDFSLSKNPLLVVAEAIEKPGNLGTILRSCDAVGVDGLIVADRCTDIHNPNVVRASVGTLFSVPLLEAEGKEVIAWLKKKGIAIVAATPSAKVNYTDADLSGPLAIAVGTEQYGLSPLWMEQADIQVSLPMRGEADSLNVATATTVLLYEALRQRGLRD